MAGTIPEVSPFTNSIGISFTRIEPGVFCMGQENPSMDSLTLLDVEQKMPIEWDEYPAHSVSITKPFFMSLTQITNAQYEEFDSSHRSMRGKGGVSMADNDAVVFVSWDDACKFCEWLSEKEHLPYRLATEAEWEYACRAGTSTLYNIGDRLPDGFQKINPNIGPFFIDIQFPKGSMPKSCRIDASGSLAVGETPANAWGLYDMHGNVEEWCLDWFGPYEPENQTDPVGPAGGDARITRGGSHSTLVHLLRSTNRTGSIPEARTPRIGFRMVIGDMSESAATPRYIPQNQMNVLAAVPQKTQAAKIEDSYFSGPKEYVHIPSDAVKPMYSAHNHHPSIVVCSNGDLLAIWYSCIYEAGPELLVVGSRLRAGEQEWEVASPFWNTPDRNDHAPVLFVDEQGKIYHFNGCFGGLWGEDYSRLEGVILRTSTDSGATWSPAHQISSECYPTPSVIEMMDGAILATFDDCRWFTKTYATRDNGATWKLTSTLSGNEDSVYPGSTGPFIAGLHASVVELRDGRLLAFGRLDTNARQSRFGGHMPMSISEDGGVSWKYSASPFPSVGSCQRAAMMRLNEGPIVLFAFTDIIEVTSDDGLSAIRLTPDQKPGILFTDSQENEFVGHGLYATVSFDEGETWPVRRLVTPGYPTKMESTTDNIPFELSATNAEPEGYLQACQTEDGLIHLISSRLHYKFNLAWLQQFPAAACIEDVNK